MIRATIDISVVLFTSNFRIADAVVETMSPPSCCSCPSA
jgi:hypothetical protein